MTLVRLLRPVLASTAIALVITPAAAAPPSPNPTHESFSLILPRLSLEQEAMMFEKLFSSLRRNVQMTNILDYVLNAPKFDDRQSARLDETQFEAVRAKAESSDAEAQSELGRYMMARGDRDGAKQWFCKAADQGLPKAKHNLAVLAHMEGDIRTALTLFNEAHAQGWVNSTVAMSALIIEADEPDRAIPFLLPAAQGGYAPAQDLLAEIYFKRDKPEDDALARNWSIAAGTQGMPESIARLGWMIHEGRTFPQDPKRAAALFLRAAQFNDSGSQMMIGGFYHLGVGVEQNDVEAAHWIMRSADQGNDVAASYLKAQRGLAGLPKAALEEGRRRADKPLEPSR